jgi:hypothetical protein
MTHCAKYNPFLLDELIKKNDNLHMELEEEHNKLIAVGLNPIDFHPLPCYAPDDIKKHYDFYEGLLKEFYNE